MNEPVPAPATFPQGPKSLLSAVRTNQIIRGAMVQGIVVILAVFWFISRKGADVENAFVFVLVGGLICVGTVVASFVAPHLIQPSSSVQRSNELADAIETVGEKELLPNELAPLLAAYTTRSLVVGALLEGGAVVNSVLWFQDGNLVHFLFVAVPIALMVIRFPTVGELREFLVQQTRTLS